MGVHHRFAVLVAGDVAGEGSDFHFFVEADHLEGLFRRVRPADHGMVEGADLKQEDVDKAVAILDPNYDQRIELSTKIVNDSVQDVVARMEPQMREGMNLAEIDRQINGLLANWAKA